MKRALLWVGVFLLIVLLNGLITYPRPDFQHDQVLLFFLGLVLLIWLCVGVAWGARGLVRYLRR